MREDFAVFIISYNRANILTADKALRKAGYTGPIYIVVDDKDPQLEEYRKRYGDSIKEFSKTEIRKTVDVMDNFSRNDTAVLARHGATKIARELGYKYMFLLDDDAVRLTYVFLEDGKKREYPIKNFDAVVDVLISLLEDTKAVAFMFGLDLFYIGGGKELLQKGYSYLGYCSYLYKVDRPPHFVGRFNEDVNAVLWHWRRGEMMFMLPYIRFYYNNGLGDAEGGLQDAYRFYKGWTTFSYLLMLQPTIPMMATEKFIRHGVKGLSRRMDWNKLAVKIVPESIKRGA